MTARTLLAMALGASLAVLPVSAVRAQGAERLFYYVDNQTSWDDFVRHVDQVTIVAPQTYAVDSIGVVYGDVDSMLVALARQHHVKVMPLVVDAGFNQPMLRHLLADTVAQARATAALVELCRRYGYYGIQFDVENVSIQDGARFTRWYTDAARALHAAGFAISIAIVPRASDLAGPTTYHEWIFDSWRGAYDLAALARVSDFVSWMTYDQHTTRTPPGPVAGIPWMRATTEYALRVIPPEKLSLGIPLYSYHWFVQANPLTVLRAGVAGATVPYAWGAHIIERDGGTIQWDARNEVPFGVGERGAVNEWVYLEDARAFRAKLALMRELKVRGFSAWVLGEEDPRIWDSLP